MKKFLQLEFKAVKFSDFWNYLPNTINKDSSWCNDPVIFRF